MTTQLFPLGCLFVGLTLAGSTLTHAQGRAPAPPAPAAPPAPVAAPALPAAADESRRVAFLGVETTPVDPALAAQLGLGEGLGLTVRAVGPGTAAAEVLQRHDVLVKLDDQWITGAAQLGTLVRLRQPGDTVRVTYRRAGQEHTATITLGARPERPTGDRPADWREALEQLPERLRHLGDVMPPGEVQRVLELARERAEPALRWRVAPAAPPVPPAPGPGQTMKIMRRDDQGSVELSITAGEHHLRVMDAAGREIFSGPVTTEEQRQALSPEVRAHLNRLPAREALGTGREGRPPEGRIFLVPPPAPQTRAPGPAATPLQVRPPV